jgi:threonine synthase
MRFISTRGRTAPHSFSDAVAVGLAPDGGLFVPETFPDISGEVARFAALSYPELCFEFLSLFADDIPADTLRSIVEVSYRKFDNPETAVLRTLGERLRVLELFYGPTLAFKDFGLQLLGNLYEHQCRVRRESINALGATSGDTGAAAIHGLLGKPRTAIFVLYPEGRISPLQERQMACTGAGNVFAMPIGGTFDDAQALLKEVLGDNVFRAKHHLSAVNSINLARLLAQSVYYLYAWLRLSNADRANVEFVVPTGNFGNVLAGWLLSRMGIPIGHFRVATNQNDILHRFFTKGEYRIGPVRPSCAPSMDIQAASNFERFIYFAMGRESGRLEAAMKEFKATGVWTPEGLDKSILAQFRSSTCSDAEIPSIIRRTYERHGFILDPHTACGFKDLSLDRISIVLATASPAKFPKAIRSAIGIESTHPSLEELKSKPLVKYPVRATADAVRKFIEQHAVR